jgi:hypothetical protein
MCRLLGGRKKGARKKQKKSGKWRKKVYIRGHGSACVCVCVCRLLGRDVRVETKGWREVAGKVYIRGNGCVSGRRIVASWCVQPCIVFSSGIRRSY